MNDRPAVGESSELSLQGERMVCKWLLVLSVATIIVMSYSLGVITVTKDIGQDWQDHPDVSINGEAKRVTVDYSLSETLGGQDVWPMSEGWPISGWNTLTILVVWLCFCTRKWSKMKSILTAIVVYYQAIGAFLFVLFWMFFEHNALALAVLELAEVDPAMTFSLDRKEIALVGEAFADTGRFERNTMSILAFCLPASLILLAYHWRRDVERREIGTVATIDDDTEGDT